MNGENTSQERRKVRPVDRFVDISGTDEFGHGKAYVALVYSTRYDDEEGTTVVRRELNIAPKPIVMVSQHAGYATVLLDFLSNEDMDLRQAWELLSDYSRPENSIAWTDEELESGVYVDESGKEQPIYFPLVELVLSPVGKETEYQIHGINPAFYTLQPNGPEGQPSVLQLVFPEEALVVADEIDEIDYDSIQREIREEEEAALMQGGVQPSGEEEE